MDRTRKRDGRTDGLTDGRTVRLLYAAQSSFGGIKKKLVFLKILFTVAVQSLFQAYFV